MCVTYAAPPWAACYCTTAATSHGGSTPRRPSHGTAAPTTATDAPQPAQLKSSRVCDYRRAHLPVLLRGCLTVRPRPGSTRLPAAPTCTNGAPRRPRAVHIRVRGLRRVRRVRGSRVGSNTWEQWSGLGRGVRGTYHLAGVVEAAAGTGARSRRAWWLQQPHGAGALECALAPTAHDARRTAHGARRTGTSTLHEGRHTPREDGIGWAAGEWSFTLRQCCFLPWLPCPRGRLLPWQGVPVVVWPRTSW